MAGGYGASGGRMEKPAVGRISNRRLLAGRLAAVFLILPLLACGVAHSQTTAQKADRPDMKVGDNWTYAYIDRWTNQKVYERAEELVSATDQEIRIKWTRLDSTASGVNAYTREFNRTELNAGTSEQRKSSPFFPNYAFPLEVGKTWEREVTFTRESSSRIVVAKLKGEVVGIEKITVPAGTFEAFKIEIKGYYNGSDITRSWSGTMSITNWYAPNVKRSVKYEYEDTAGNKTYNKDSYELIKYLVH